MSITYKKTIITIILSIKTIKLIDINKKHAI